MDIKDIIKSWAEGGYSEEKLAELREAHPDLDWLALAGRVMSESQHLRPRFETSTESLWEAIERKVDGVEEPEPEVEEVEVQEDPILVHFRRRRNRRRYIIAAASIALLVTLLFTLNRSEHRNWEMLSTLPGQSQEITLPEGSKVFLAAASKLEWNKDDWKEQRELSLEGEAFFEVEPGTPFTVETGKYSVRVLGTSFNVRSREGKLDVDCQTGKVEVNTGTEKAALTAGQTLHLEGNPPRLSRGESTTTEIGTWREGLFYYTGESLSTVMSEVERQFNCTVLVADAEIANQAVNGYFSNESLEQALKQICAPLNLEYVIDGKKQLVRIDR